MKTTYLVSLAIFAVANAVPASVNKWDPFTTDDSFDTCAATCSKQQSKFAYKTGSTYVYDYSVSTDTSMARASEESAKLSMQARAEIQVIDVCEFALQLKDIKVYHTDGFTGALRQSQREDEYQTVLQGSSLRFSFNDGIISSVCPESSESTWALNFKRGVLTAFQNSMNSLDKSGQVSEVDVSGECQAVFNVSTAWNWKQETSISKTKNLLACSGRDGYSSMYQIIPYKVQSEIQSLPILKGTHKCDYVISSNKVLQSAICMETHTFVPFSNQESGGKTTVQQQLIFNNEKNGVESDIGPVKSRLSLLFDHSGASKRNQNGPESLEQKLKEICDQTQDDLRPETPRLYSELVQIIKGLSKSDLDRIYNLVKDKVICPKNVRTLKFFMDALPMAASDGAVSLMTTLINSQQVEEILSRAWLTSLALIQEPTASMIEDGLKLLKGSSSAHALLSVTALVNNYCKKTSGCENDYYVSQIQTFLQSKITRYCSVDDKNLKEILLTLRAIGNTGLNLLTSSLDTCINSDSTPLEVRVAAANAYRRMSCADSTGERDNSLWKVLSDSKQDLELRITSYLSVMRCPDDGTLTKIMELLETDDIDEHLGGFIYSHIENLKETSDPLKQDLAKVLNSYNFKEFSTNLFKYSSNHEASVLIKRLNLGFAADSNIIMSSSSPLPRSAMLNLTVDLFGNSINIFEIGGRVEGLEVLLEKLIGPTGYFTNKGDKKSIDKLSDVKASIYARVFGNELLYEQSKGLQRFQGPDKMPNFLEILMNFANRQTAAYTFSEQLMDVSLIVPTVAGLPLELAVNGSINLDVKAEGKVDLRKVATSPRSMEIDGELRPSAALEITGTMAIHALSTKMGLRMRNTMHSSTWLKGHIEINRGQVLNIEIEPPGDKMEIFNARSQFFIVHDEVEKEQNMIKDNYQEYKVCSGDKLATVLGVELCGELKFPNASGHYYSPYFPLTGPSSLSIMTYRRDTHNMYKLLAMRKETKDSSVAKFLMDTPNSNVNRMISTDITITYNPDKLVDVTLISPWKKVILNSAVIANKDLVSFVGSLLLDDKDKYGLTTELKMSKTGNSATYSPFVELAQDGQTETLLSGLVSLDLPSKLDTKLEIKGFGMLPYNIEGGLVNQDKQKQVSLSLSKQGKNLYFVNLGSTIDISGKDNRNVKVEPTILVKAQDENLVSITGSSDYKYDKSANGDLTVDLYKMKPASIQWKVSKNSKSALSSYNVDLKLKSSILTVTVNGDANQQKNSMSSTLKVTYNAPKLGTDSITWNTKWNNKSKPTFQKYIITSNLDMKKNPDYNSALTLRLDYKKKQTDIDMDVKYGANFNDKWKIVTFSSTFNKNSLSWKNTDVDFIMKASVPQQNVDLNVKMDHSHTSDKLNSNLNLKFSPYITNMVDVGLNLQDKSTKFLNYVGKANLGILGKKVAVSSELNQKSAKQYEHSLDIQDFDGNNHVINTVYQMPSSNRHELTADVNLNGYQPILLQGRTILDLSNFQATGNAAYGKDIYNVSVQTKLTDTSKKLNFGFEKPNRQVEAEFEVKNFKDKMTSNFIVDWDAKRNSKSKVSIETSYRNSHNRDTRIITGTVNVKTPFAKFEDLTTEGSYSSDSSQYSTKGKISWGGKQETVSSNFVVKLPLSPQKIDISFVATTPIRQYREVELEINHRLDLTLASSIKGKLEDNKAEITVKGENRGDKYSSDFLGLINVKTPFARLRDASISLEHKDDGNNLKSVSSIGYNNQKFGADLQMDRINGRSSVENNAKLVLTWPEDQLQTTWQYKLLGNQQLNYSMESKWSGNKQIVVDLTGSNNLNRNVRHVLATLNVQTPWQNSRDLNVQIENKLTSDKLESSFSVLNNKIEKFVYNVLLENNNNAQNAIFMLKSPLYDHKVHGQTKLQWYPYPMTAAAWIEWAPWSRIDFDGSLNIPSTSEMALSTKITTPFKNYENIIVGASHKFDNSEYVSQARVNYGVRKSIIFENKLRIDSDVKVLRTKLTSSYGVHSLESSYKFDIPFQWDITLKTPHESFENLGFTATFVPTETSLQSRLRVMYQLNKAVDSQLKLKWDSNYDGSLVITTPFINYENNKFLVQYNKNNKGFTSHGEVSLGGENAQGDVSFSTSNSGTSGSTSLTSSISGLEKFSAIFNVKGPLNQMKADASVNTGSNILSTTFTNYINPGQLKSTLTINSPYIQDVKLSVNLKDSSSYPETKLESGFNGQYGAKHIDAKAGLSYAGLEKIKADFSLDTPYYSGQLSLENNNYPNGASGKGSLQTDVKAIGNIEVNYEKNGPLDNMLGTAAVIRNGESLIKVTGNTNFPDDSVFANVKFEGKLIPIIVAQVDHKGSISDFSCKASISCGRNLIENEVIFKFDDSQLDLSNNIKVNIKSIQRRHSINIHKEGTLKDLKIEISRKLDSDEITAVLAFQADDAIKGLIEINNLSDRYDKVGAQFEHNGDVGKFVTTGKVTISSSENFSGKVNFYRYDFKRIEASVELNTPWEGYRYSSFAYRHEGVDNRLTCNLNVEYGDGNKISTDMMTQTTPLSNSLSFNLKTPFSGYENILLAGDYDQSKINGKANMGKGKDYAVSGFYESGFIQYQITTPLDALRKLTINLKGSLLDGTADATVISFNKKIQGNGAFQYTSPYKLSLSTDLQSNIKGYPFLKLKVNNDEDSARGKTSKLQVSWDPTKQVVIDGRFFSGDSAYTAKQENILEFNFKGPFEALQSVSVNVEHNFDTTNIQGLLSLEVDQKKLVDVDVTFDKRNNYAYSTVVRQPWPMEYTSSYNYNDFSKEGDVYINWNRDDPNSNVRIKTTLQSQTSSNDNLLTVTITSPQRTIGVEHSMSSSNNKLTCSGKFYWDQDDDSKLSYSVDIRTVKRRRDTTFNGDFKLGFLNRVLGLTGSLSNNDVTTTADAAISWDLGRDDSKRLQVQASFTGQEFTKADISIKLPSQTLQVDSAIILNQGNVILDGKTDISYSRDAMKTLTLFSKLKNTPTVGYFGGSGNSFNYSVELGVSHPDTKIDWKVDSHVASSDDLITSSLGFKFMTVRRKTKNLALFAEIDKIRRQINLLALGPASSTGLSGKLESDDPISLVVVGSLNGQEKLQSKLLVDTSSKTLKFEIGQSDRLFSFKSFYPNSSAIEAEILNQIDIDTKESADAVLNLLDSQHLHSSINWRPGMFEKLGNFAADQISVARKNTQENFNQINSDLQAELNDKYEQVRSSVVDDMLPLRNFVSDESESVTADLASLKLKLLELHSDNVFFLRDICTTSGKYINYDSLSYYKNKIRDMVSQNIENKIELVESRVNALASSLLINSPNTQAVLTAMQNLPGLLNDKLDEYTQRLVNSDFKLTERANDVWYYAQSIYRNAHVDELKMKLLAMKNINYFNKLNNALNYNDYFNNYYPTLISWKDSVVSRVLPERIRDLSERLTYELYQQGFDFMNTYEEHLKDIIADELIEYIDKLAINNPVTFYDSKLGLGNANLHLPIELKTLDSQPDISPYIQKAKNMYKKYTPYVGAIAKYLPNYNSSVQDLSDKVNSDENILANLAEFNPKRKQRNSFRY